MSLSIKANHPEMILSEGEHLGFAWLVVHNGIGYRCGYIRLPKGHPWHGKDYDGVSAEVHGGLTFSEPDTPCEKGGPDDAWWIGFDCCHLWDKMDESLPNRHPVGYRIGGEGTIKTTAYVEAECRSLCEQAVKAVNE